MAVTPQSPEPVEADRWHCPAFDRIIEGGFCWECSMAEYGGPTDTAEWLRHWAAGSSFGSVADFQAVCAFCPHRPWHPSPNRSGQSA